MVGKITGMLFLREMGGAERLLPGENRKLMVVLGIVAVDKECVFKGEHQYVVSGDDYDTTLQLDVLREGEVDRTKLAIGVTPDGLLRLPIWRV